MAFNISREFPLNFDLNSFVKGPQILTPYSYQGNAQGRHFSDEGGEDAFFGKSTVGEDTQDATLIYPFLHPGLEKDDPPTVVQGQQCLKRYVIEVNHIKEGPGAQNGGVPGAFNNCPGPGFMQRGLERSCWGQTAGERIKSNLQLDFDTIDLHCGGSHAPGQNRKELGRYGPSDLFAQGIFPVRGLPIKFQKVYFYGSRGSISGCESSDASIPFNYRKQSDGRGALFSTYILCASAAVNSLSPYGGKGAGYDCGELSKYGLAGGSFTYLQSTRSSSSCRDFFMPAKEEYERGIDVEWGADNGAGTQSPLVIGDGALGFREEFFGKEIFGKVDTYEVTETSKWWEQEVTLCIGDEQIVGTVLFKPKVADTGLFPDDEGKMLIHDMRNTFSCVSIVPVNECTKLGTPGKDCCLFKPGEDELAMKPPPRGTGLQPTPLPWQHEKVQVIEGTSILLRTACEAMSDISSYSDCGESCDVPLTTAPP